MGNDVRHFLRTLGRNPGFAAIAILTLALGIGANTAIFSVFHAVLLRPLPYTDPGRLVSVEEVVSGAQWQRFGPSLPVTAWHFREWRRTSRSFRQLALVGGTRATLTGSGDPLQLTGGRVSTTLFPMLGIQAQLGRTFREDEDQPGSASVVVLSDRLWTSRFHSDPSVVGSKIQLNGRPFQVVGVLGRSVHVPNQGELYGMARFAVETDYWVPFAISENDLAIMAEFNYGCVARLKPGVSMAQATEDLNAVQATIVKDLPEKVGLRALLTPLQKQMAGGAGGSLTLLLSAAGLVLLMVVVNLANLLLARASARKRELAIRTALGAGMGRIVRQMLTESLLLAAIGGALGIGLAEWALSAVLATAPLDLPGLKDVRLDAAALAFAVAITVGSGLLFAILPAWRMARTDPQDALKSGGRATTEGKQGGAMRRLLIAAEVALCSLCLVVGGLLLNSFVRLIHVDKGFQTDRALTLSLSLPASRYPDMQKRAAFVRSLTARIGEAPSVVAAGVSNRGPLSGEGSNLGMFVDGVTEKHTVDYRCVTPDFFRAMAIPTRSGRMFAETDRDRKVAMISAQVAGRMWPNQDPMGRHFRLGSRDEEAIEVVGVVGDIRTSLDHAPNMTVYLPYWQLARPDIAVVVRTAAAPLTIAGAVRNAVHELDRDLPEPSIRTVDAVVDSALAERRFQLMLVLVFAVSALLLAAIGVYGVVSQSVARRTNEIGIRMALGASRQSVRWMVAAQGLAPVVLGLALGLVGAAAVSRLVSGFLFGVTATDPATFAEVAGVLVASALAACYFPTRRATRVDPLVALRYE